MSVIFSRALQHIQAPPDGSPQGRVVLSQMPRGDSPIYCATPSLKYVLEGEERYEVDGVVQVVRPGQFLIVDAGVHLRAVLPRRETTTGLCIYLPAGGAIDWVSRSAAPEIEDARTRALGSKTFLVSGEARGWTSRLKQAALSIVADPAAGEALAADLAHGAAVGLTGMLTDIANDLERIVSIKYTTRRHLLQRLSAIRANIIDTPLARHTLGELAATAGISQFHLARLFRAVYGVPLVAFQRQKRLEAVLSQLRADQLSLAEAALLAGYGDATAFSRAIRRQFGETPGRLARLLES